MVISLLQFLILWKPVYRHVSNVWFHLCPLMNTYFLMSDIFFIPENHIIKLKTCHKLKNIFVNFDGKIIVYSISLQDNQTLR